MEDFVLAYRQTKADVFAERSIPSRIALLSYEENLIERLDGLRSKVNHSLAGGSSAWLQEADFLGKIVRQPKSVSPERNKSDQEDQPHLYVTDAKDRWQDFKSRRNPHAKFRTMAIPSIDFQVLGMLWITHVGHLLDQKLLSCCRGNRLKRNNDGDDSSEDKNNDINRDSPNVFTPYYHAYRNWRNDGLKAIEGELERDNRVVAITMDLRSYFHRIDPEFLIIPGFWKDTMGIELVPRQKALNKLLTESLVAWSSKAPEKTGLPVGFLASRVIANALLHEFDRVVTEQMHPVFYARYVDDILLVLRAQGSGIQKPQEIMRRVARGLGKIADPRSDGAKLKLRLPHIGRSVLEFGSDKQRIFDFRGQAGLDLLSTIKKEIDELSSEFRLMPDFTDDDGSVLKQALTADHDLELGADSLRKADSLTIRRMGLAILLRNHELLERCMADPKQWNDIRKPFYELIENHVLTPERYCTYFQYLPRIFGLIAANGDWDAGDKLLTKLQWVLDEVGSLPNQTDKPL